MNIEKLKEVWINHADKNVDESIKMWDSFSESYKEKPTLKWETNEFLKLIDKTVNVSKDMKSLDIGCGAGGYTMALAEKVKKAVGIDFSPSMIKLAKEKEVDNAEFICADWDKFDIKKEKFEKNFDIVFAHMTPAINNAYTFEKLIACSKKYCFIAKPTRRKDPILEEIKKIAGLEDYYQNFDESITYAFDMVWQLGYCPYFFYRDEVWESEKTLEEAYEWYIRRVKTYKNISQSVENDLKKYLNSILVNGKIHEKTTTTIVNMYWQI
ncbi:class I SAM-dependent methyltransferase [Anaerovorax odorimutans]|uniref:class I SAM-dependent methyltransferase n=1 Tax=Anaerovorax odorimutans TaxID=109327 RepID=UPI0004132C6B|nr:class I SAM-dependent methyltransferase [Anaerovorax odorimutans]